MPLGETAGTLLIEVRFPGGRGHSPLGEPGEERTLIPDHLVVSGANVYPEYPGLVIEFGNGLSVTNAGSVILDNVRFNGIASISLAENTLCEFDGSLTSSVPLTIQGGTLTVDRVVVPELRLTNNAVLTSLTSTTNEMHKLEVQVDGIAIIDSTSRVDLSGKGYVPGRTRGNTTVGAASGNGGDSYGGRGSNGSNALYGDFADPEDWGSSSGITSNPSSTV
jgi:hypothetical protein